MRPTLGEGIAYGSDDFANDTAAAAMVLAKQFAYVWLTGEEQPAPEPMANDSTLAVLMEMVDAIVGTNCFFAKLRHVFAAGCGSQRQIVANVQSETLARHTQEFENRIVVATSVSTTSRF